MLVSVTSSEDWATRSAFPIGRFVNSIMQDAANEEERIATKYTMGHMTGARANYITHELTFRSDEEASCKHQAHLARVSQEHPEPIQTRRDDIAAELANSRTFFRNTPRLSLGWERPFCGGVRLAHKQNDPNSVIWNIRIDETTMKHHNDISNPHLIDFLRQMYQEAVLHTWWVGSDTEPPAASATK